LSDRILIAENWCAALFVSTVSPDSETAALQCGRPVSIVPPFTRPDTWTRPPVSRVEWDLPTVMTDTLHGDLLPFCGPG
jgi:hypothetical protein